MARNLQIDEKLLEDVKKAGNHCSIRETVNSALTEHMRRREQMKIFDLAGMVEYDSGYNHKKQRRRNSAGRRKRGSR